MRITPMDIRQQQFTVKMFRGFDTQEVDTFLEDLASDYEALLKENSLLKEQLQALEERTRGLEEREKVLQETLVTAQKASQEIREAARRETQITLSDAELQAEKIVQGAHARFLRVVDEINELKRQRVQLEGHIRMIVESHLKLLDAFREPAQEAVPLISSRKKAGEE